MGTCICKYQNYLSTVNENILVFFLIKGAKALNTFCFNNTPPFHFKYHISRKFQEQKSFGPWQCRPYLIPSRAWQKSFTDAKRKMRLVMGVWFCLLHPQSSPSEFLSPEAILQEYFSLAFRCRFRTIIIYVFVLLVFIV